MKKLIFVPLLILFSLFAKSQDIVVAKDGSGDYTTVQAAFDAVPSNSSRRTVIYIKNGIYKELLTLNSDKTNVTIIGESVDGVVLTYDNYASKINPSTGSAYGTSGSASTYIYGSGFYAWNITFQNSAGPVGQALAIYINGDKAVFRNCKFLGYQDTMYGNRCRQYFTDCYIEGSTDFIFGPSTAYFENCQIYSKGGTALTAASTESYVPYGYVFDNCTVTGASGVSTYLGRTWRPYAATTFMNSNLSSIINPEGWNDWGSSSNDATARYHEYNNSGAGANLSGRVSWMSVLTSSEAANYTATNVLKTTYTDPITTDNWNPFTVINNTSAISSSCSPTTIIPYIQVNGGSWQQTSSVTVTSGSSVKFGPQPTQGGSWSWSGCGTSGTSREQTVYPTGSCSSTATYTNTCGAQSSQNFTVTVSGGSSLTIQENATGFCSVDGTVDNNHTGYTGSGFANTVNANGNGITWSVNLGGGSYPLVWRYANGASARSSAIMIDGNTAGSLSFGSTGSWDIWATSSAYTVDLSPGTHLIRLQATNSGGLPNIDYLTITGAGISAVSCSGQKSAGTLWSAHNNDIKIYPNPVNGNTINIAGVLNIDSKVSVYIYNSMGQIIRSRKLGVVEKGNFEESVKVDLHPGTYFMKIIMNTSVKNIPFIME